MTLRKWNASRVIYLNVFILVLLVTFVVIVETVDRRILDLCILGGRVFRFMLLLRKEDRNASVGGEIISSSLFELPYRYNDRYTRDYSSDP